MNASERAPWLCGLALLLFGVQASAAPAASSLEGAIRACAGQSNAVERLACFDAAAKALPSVTGASAPLPVAPAPAVVATANFGLKAVAAERVSAVQSRIVGPFDGWKEGTVITLENGQRWRVAEPSTRYLPVRDPQAIVREGMLGSFLLEVVGSNVQVRVRRVP